MKKQPTGTIIVCCSHQACSPHSKGSWPDSSPLWCLGKLPFLRKQRDDTCLFSLLAITAINAHVSQWVLNYLLKLYMASLTWHWHQRGLCLKQEPEEHTELLQGKNQLISLLVSNLQHCKSCRWKPDKTTADLSPSGLDAAPRALPGPGATQGGSKSPKAFSAVHHSAHLLPETPWGVRRRAQVFQCCFLLSLFLSQLGNVA